MRSVAVAIAVFVLVTVAFGLLLSGASTFKIGFGIVPGILAGFGTYFYVVSKKSKLVQASMEEAQKVMVPKDMSMVRKHKPRFEEAIAVLEKGRDETGKWVPFGTSLFDAQIGQIHFLAEDYDKAMPFLAKAMFKQWTPIAMLASIQYKKKQYDEMETSFERAVKHNGKESLLWNMYAWCLWKADRVDKAIDVLNRAGKALSTEDERTTRNLNNLQNGKKVSMKGWREMWWMFRLEAPPASAMQSMKQQRGGRRQMYRGR